MPPENEKAGVAAPANIIEQSANDCVTYNRREGDPFQFACAWLGTRHALRPTITPVIAALARLGGVA